MQSWQLNGPKLVKFGPRVRNEVIPLAKALARRAIVLVGSRTLRQSSLCQQWLEDFQKQLPVECSLQLPAREPQVDDVNHLAHSLRELSAGPDDVVIVVGGGSSIDMVKAACGLATQKEVRSCQDYLEGVGTGAKLIQAPLRWIALPTTAGTGSEATRNAVISSDDSSTSTPFKKSFRSDELYAQAVFLDPEWTLSLPRQVTISSGLDALTQLLESAISSRATPYTFMLSQQGLAWGLPAFEQLLQEPENLDARGKMLSAAYLSGVALANSGLGAAHGVAAGLGAILPVPHGLACAVMLPHTLAYNFSTSQSALEIMARSAGLSATPNTSAATQLIERITHLVHLCQIPQRLRNLGVTQEMIPQLVELSQGNSLQGNPRPISPAELEQWLCSIW